MDDLTLKNIQRIIDLKASFTPEESETHALIRELLWVMYPRDETVDIKPSEDSTSDQSAAFIVDAMRSGKKACMG